jgi:hypothetical protein
MVQTLICTIVSTQWTKNHAFKKKKKLAHYATLGSLKDPRVKPNAVHANLLLTC